MLMKYTNLISYLTGYMCFIFLSHWGNPLVTVKKRKSPLMGTNIFLFKGLLFLLCHTSHVLSNIIQILINDGDSGTVIYAILNNTPAFNAGGVYYQSEQKLCMQSYVTGIL